MKKPDIEKIMIGGYVTDFDFKSGNMKDFNA